MWACALGFTEVALLLYQWNKAAVKVSNNRGIAPLAIASERGNNDVVEQIEKFERSDDQLLTSNRR